MSSTDADADVESSNGSDAEGGGGSGMGSDAEGGGGSGAGPGARVRSEAALRRVLTFPWLLLYGLGSTVGAGIYILIGVVAGRAGGWAPVAFVVAALLAVFTAQSFAALSARFPHAGGALVYVYQGFGRRWLSVVVGLSTATAGLVSAAAVSLGFVAYLAALISVPGGLALAAVVVGVGAIAAWGIKESIVAAGIVTLAEIGGLVAVLIAGAAHLASGPAVDVVALLPTSPGQIPVVAILHSAVLCFYAFLGFEDIVNVAEEVRDVRRVMPRAILWTLGISALLYLVVAAVSVLVVPPDELGRADAPLALVFERSGGSAPLLAAVALVAMLNGALVQMVMVSRILYSLARDGVLPGWLARVDPRTGTPLLATGLVTLGVWGLASLLPIEQLAAATASVALFVFVLVNASLLRLLLAERRRGAEPVSGRSLAVPALGALASLAFLAIEGLQRLAAL
jgi:amino acid transporter